MKKIICIFVAALLLVCCVNIKEQNDTQYLRLHIRANSNSEYCQSIKWEAKSVVEDALYPLLEKAESFSEALEISENACGYVEEKVNGFLKEKGVGYTARVTLKKEYFPTRSYGNLTLPEGVYDALIVSLGEGVGDNWWCVLFPPICYSGSRTDGKRITYKSFFKELFERLIKGGRKKKDEKTS